jgi:hypothetical protein
MLRDVLLRSARLAATLLARLTSYYKNVRRILAQKTFREKIFAVMRM